MRKTRYFIAGPAALLFAASSAAADPGVRPRLQAMAEAFTNQQAVKVKKGAAELAALGGHTPESVLEIALEEGPSAQLFGESIDERVMARLVLPIVASGRDGAILESLIKTARGSDSRRAFKAVELMDALQDRRAAPALIALLKPREESDPQERRQANALRIRAAQALGSLKEPSAVRPVLDAMLHDPDMTVRLVAVRDVLPRIGGAEALAGVREAMEDKDPVVKMVAEKSLREAGGLPALAQEPKARPPTSSDHPWAESPDVVRAQAKAVRELLASLPAAAFRSNLLAGLGPVRPAGVERGSPAEVQKGALAFVDQQVIEALDRAEERPGAALRALTLLLSGIYDLADGSLGGYPDDDILPGAKDQKKLQEEILKLVSFYSPRCAAWGKVAPSGGKVRLEAGSSIEVPAGALKRPVDIIFVGACAGGPSALFVFHPSGLAFAKPAHLDLKYPSSGRGKVWTQGNRPGKTLQSGDEGTLIEVDGFW
jgi:HEAT repeat protein